ncbi:MAG: hypothetical protein DMF82_03070, partial [Acidobacteria bacterium]
MRHVPNHLLAAAVFASAVAQTLAASATADERHPARQPAKPAEEVESTRSSPKDTTAYVRPALPEDRDVGEESLRRLFSPAVISSFPTVFMVDVVVNNTNANLTNTDMRNDGEPSIAVNPLDPAEIVIHSDFGGWTGNADVWHST